MCQCTKQDYNNFTTTNEAMTIKNDKARLKLRTFYIVAPKVQILHNGFTDQLLNMII